MMDSREPPVAPPLQEARLWVGTFAPEVVKEDPTKCMDIDTLIERVRFFVDVTGKIFHLGWEGAKVPEGVRVGEHIITGTASGNAYGISATQEAPYYEQMDPNIQPAAIGSYDPTVRNGGPDGTTQGMMFYPYERKGT